MARDGLTQLAAAADGHFDAQQDEDKITRCHIRCERTFEFDAGYINEQMAVSNFCIVRTLICDKYPAVQAWQIQACNMVIARSTGCRMLTCHS